MVMFAFNAVFNKMLGVWPTCVQQHTFTPSTQNVRDQRNKVGTERSNTFALEALAVALQQPVRFMLPAAAALLSIRELGRMLLTFNPHTRTQWGACVCILADLFTTMDLIRTGDHFCVGQNQRG